MEREDSFVSNEIERREVAYDVFHELKTIFGSEQIGLVVDIGGGGGEYVAMLRKWLRIKRVISLDIYVPKDRIEGVEYIQSSA